MNRILLISPDQDLGDILHINLKHHTGADIHVKHNLQSAIRRIQEIKDFDLIITPPKHKQEHYINKIQKLFEEQQIEIPILSLGEDKTLDEDIYQISAPIKWESVIRSTVLFLGIDPTRFKNNSPTNYNAVGLIYLKHLDFAPCDLYIRVTKKDLRAKYIKLFNAGSEIDHQALKKYQNKGLKNIYIDYKLNHYFVSFMTKNLKAKLHNKELPLIKRHHATDNSQKIIQNFLTNLKVTPQIIKLTEDSIENTLDLISKTESVSAEFGFMFENELSYFYQRNHLTSLVGISMLSHLGIEDKKTQKNFAQLVFFSDIYLKTQQQIEINSMEELNYAELDSDTRELVLHHAKKASELAKSIEEMDPEVVRLLKGHHGSANGRGFPSHFSASLGEVCEVFIIADAYTKMRLNPNMPDKNAEILTILYTKFPDKNFQKITHKLNSVLR